MSNSYLEDAMITFLKFLCCFLDLFKFQVWRGIIIKFIYLFGGGLGEGSLM